MRTFLVLEVHDEGLQNEYVIHGKTFRDACLREFRKYGKFLMYYREDNVGGLSDEEFVDSAIKWMSESYVDGDSQCQVIVYDVTYIPQRLLPEYI